ncbi:hypothetical protein AURDEDRAFT_182010 [Auricularia subglabra TFB-10046 SS5]|nr:hypothetical protein AURDEDRAFT_182010 [Auricularia subglabra TFB-10046 SS5]
MATRTFSVFCDESAPVLPNITNTGRALAPAAPRPIKLKKAATLPAVFGNEKENVDPRTGRSTTSSFANAAPAPAAAERPAKKRRTALTTTQVRGKPVLARSRSALDAGSKKPKAPRAPSPALPAAALAPLAEFTFSSPLPSPTASRTASPTPADDVQAFAFVDGLFAGADDTTPMELEPTAARSEVTCPAPVITASAPADA